MRFEMPPHILDRIKFGRISRQPFDYDAPLGGGYIVFDQRAPMDGCASPDDQYFPRNVSLEMPQKFDDLKAFDASSMHLEIEPPKCQAADDRKTFPVESLMEHRGFPSWSPSAGPRGPGAQAAFVNKDDGSPLLPGFFLMPANPFAASDGLPFRPVPPPGVPVVGN